MKDPAASVPAAFVKETTEQVRHLEKVYYLAEWEAALSGSEQALRRVREAQAAYLGFWSDPHRFQTARQLDEAGSDDPLITRQLRMIYLTAARHQQEPSLIGQLTELESRVRGRYYNYRACVDGRELSDNQIDEILRNSRDSEQLRKAWEASKRVGAEVAEEVREMARLRNASARVQGYRDHFQQSLELDEIDERELFDVFDDLERRSESSFEKLKAEIDEALCSRFALPPEQLRPWHYGDRYFQKGPALGEADLDSLFEGRELEALARDTYRGLDLEVESILSRSDLYPRPGKNQHAFCIHIDREGDIRTLNNLQATHRWAETLLHELGHGVYERYLDPQLPWLLRAPAHTFTTEAVAILMGSLTLDPRWYTEVLELPSTQAQALTEAALRNDRAGKLIFTRWCLTMTHFERRLYADPDADLDAIWWEYVERFQLLKRPERRKAPDWAAKIHVALFPVYYHNYQLGHLLAAQIRDCLERQAGGIVGLPAAGRWLIERIFAPGARVDWRSLVEGATGEPLNVRRFMDSLGG